jgi:hypothetical protein
VKWRNLLVVGVLVAGVAALWWRLHPSEPRRVRRQLERLAGRISKGESESTAVMGLKMNALGDLFESEVVVDLADFPGNGTYASSEVASHVARFRPACRRIALAFQDVDIRVESSRQAEATFTARLIVTASNGETQTETRAVQARLHQGEDRTWRFARFAEIEVLQR